MEKYDIQPLVQAAQAWLTVIAQMKKVVEQGEWDSLDALYQAREQVVEVYQSLAGPVLFSEYSVEQLAPLNALLSAVQALENQLLIVLEEYKHYLVDSLKSIQMEGTLQQRYGLDGV
jgi:hypothetical protein